MVRIPFPITGSGVPALLVCACITRVLKRALIIHNLHKLGSNGHLDVSLKKVRLVMSCQHKKTAGPSSRRYIVQEVSYMLASMHLSISNPCLSVSGTRQDEMMSQVCVSTGVIRIGGRPGSGSATNRTTRRFEFTLHYRLPSFRLPCLLHVSMV